MILKGYITTIDVKDKYTDVTVKNLTSSLTGRFWSLRDYGGVESVQALRASKIIVILAVQDGEPKYGVPIGEGLKMANDGTTMNDYISSYDASVMLNLCKEIIPDKASFFDELFTTFNLLELFKHSIAAKKMHDASVGGLGRHTEKMLKLTQRVIEIYSDKLSEVDKAVLVTGILLHDVGKALEMDYSTTDYTEMGVRYGHRLLLIEVIAGYKAGAKVLKTHLSEKGYFDVLAIIDQHHGKFEGSQPKFATAYLAHYIDLLESHATGLFDAMENNKGKGMNSFYHHEGYISLT